MTNLQPGAKALLDGEKLVSIAGRWPRDGWYIVLADGRRQAASKERLTPLLRAVTTAEGLAVEIPDIPCRRDNETPRECAVRQRNILFRERRTWKIAEDLGVRCLDGGVCHHACTDSCFRKRCCLPFSSSIFDDRWAVKAEETALGYVKNGCFVIVEVEKGAGR